MVAFIALLRAVNVGGTGKLPMSDLRRLCKRAGFADVQTYIASGNALFTSEMAEGEIKAVLGTALERYAGKPIGVLVRPAAEMAAVAAKNPFADRQSNRTVAIFLDRTPAKDALQGMVGRNKEEVRLGKREIYVFYGEGIGRSKLRIPAAEGGTARNMNSIAKLADLAAKLSPLGAGSK